MKLKPSATQADEKKLFEDIKKSMPDSLGYMIRYSSKFRDNVERVDNIVSLLFDVVIIITMFLCFFSLSSSMSSNLYE